MRNVFTPTSEGMREYSRFIDEHHSGGGGGGGSDNYNDLSNKPSINDVQLAGNKTAEQLKLVDLKGIQAFATMPASAVAGTTIMYTGAQGVYLTGAVYRYIDNTWVMLMSPPEAVSISQAEIEDLF